MPSHRTTARVALLLAVIALGVSTGAASARPDARAGKVPQLVFPVIGETTYFDDFGAPRAQGPHEGNDILAPKRAIAVAVEAGRVKFWDHTSAGCLLYLNGKSGTQYLYIHLNNDLTKGNDNKGECGPGVSYAYGLKDGQKVAAGQPIGFVGNSGDADGLHDHLHFEVHPGGGAAADPYPFLNKAKRLLFAVTPGKPFTAALWGDIVKAADGELKLDVRQIKSWPGSFRAPGINRVLDLRVPPRTVVFDPLGAIVEGERLASLAPGRQVVAWTQKSKATLEAAMGEPFTLSTRKVQLQPEIKPR
jgi:Peptidase family M23